MQCFDKEQQIPQSNCKYYLFKVNNIDTGTTWMMQTMFIICFLKTLNRYIRLAEYLCYVNYVQPYMFQILEENLYDYDSFYEISVISWLVSADVSCFLACRRQFQMVLGRSKVFLVLVCTYTFYKKQCIGQHRRYLEILRVEENW